MHKDALQMPAYLRGALMEKAAFGRLQKAAQALLDENTEVAEASYKEAHADKFTDKMWRASDPRNARLCIELRNALKEVARCSARAKGADGG
jgi:hypothetical protein